MAKKDLKSLKPKGFIDEIREIKRELRVYNREKADYYKTLNKNPKHFELNRYSSSANIALNRAKKTAETALRRMTQSRHKIESEQKNKVEELLKEINTNIKERNKRRTREVFEKEGLEKVRQIKRKNAEGKFRKVWKTKSAYGLGLHLIGRMKSASIRKRRP